jgi:hypothetical protein
MNVMAKKHVAHMGSQKCKQNFIYTTHWKIRQNVDIKINFKQ